MQAMPRPAPRVAPATSAIFPSSGRAGFRFLSAAPRIAHLLDRGRALGLTRAQTLRGFPDHARQRLAAKLLARPNLDVAHGLALALQKSLRIGKTRAFTEAQVDVLRVAHHVTEGFS